MKEDINKLEQRITNLEVALAGLWALLKDLQPPETQIDVQRMLEEHFTASSCLGGFRRANFDIEG